jgi:multidrug efflux pump subunit AcrA (membrane-fusion protein)
MDARPAAPVKGEDKGRIALDRRQRDAPQLLGIVRLLALERPRIERLDESLGAQAFSTEASHAPDAIWISVGQARRRDPMRPRRLDCRFSHRRILNYLHF